jgi:hypothetical protein
MKPIWLAVVGVAVLLLITRIRSRRRMQAQRRRPPAPGPRIQGSQVNAYIHPRMGAACLQDSGLQFGKGFRRKEGPALPHDAECGCEAIPFAFTSNEVFNGALHRVGTVKSTLEGLTRDDANKLVERLKAAEAGPLAPEPAAYEAAVGVEAFPPALQAALRAFLAERYAYLQERERETPAGSEPVTPDRMESSEPT